jgi:hypothetical protein
MNCTAPELLTPETDATMVYPVPARSTMTLEKVPMPDASVTADNVPERIGRFVLVATPSVTVTPGIAAPVAPSARTRIAGEMAWPAVVALGCVMNWS